MPTVARLGFSLALLGSLWAADETDTTPQITAPATNPTVTPVTENGPEAKCDLCHLPMPSRFGTPGATTTEAPKGMVWIPGGTYQMGANAIDPKAAPDEKPAHKVTVSGFWMDECEVTNAEFAEFVKATKYITTAEIKPDWEEIKLQLPPGTPKVDDSVLVPSSLVFFAPPKPVPLNSVNNWWRWVPGADWRHPSGPNSSIEGKDNYPVVQVTFEDVEAYCAWAKKRVPTEAEWEFAARGGLENKIYAWGDEAVDTGTVKANTFQGHFPDKNTVRDGYANASPVKSFAPNGYGLYDISGNVWEWCSDWYRADTFAKDAEHPEGVTNPKGPDSSFDPDEPMTPKRIVRSGSFLCHDSYCSSYRVSARMKTDVKTSLEHTGFRCVRSP